MNRDLLRPAVIALLAVVAIAVGGATLDSAVSPGGVDRDPGVGSAPSEDDAWTPFSLNVTDEEEDGGGRPSATLGVCIAFLRRPSVIVGLLGLVVLSTVPVYRRAGVLGSLSVLFVVLPIGTLVYAFLTDCRAPVAAPAPLPFGFGRNNGTPNGTVGNATGSATGAEGLAPPTVLVLIGGLLAVALLVAVLRSTGDDAVEEEAPADDDDEALAAIGEAAGDAADRIVDDASLDNEVYRAWREMTDLLDVANPQASTPGEFARAATDAGMEPEHVEALTDVFREVRYGGADVTDERERRAVDALRRIEDAYAGEGQP